MTPRHLFITLGSLVLAFAALYALTQLPDVHEVLSPMPTDVRDTP